MKTGENNQNKISDSLPKASTSEEKRIAMKASRLAQKKAKRKKNPHLGQFKIKLQTEPKKGFQLAWVTDKGSTVQDYLNRGYDFCAKDGGFLTHDDVGGGDTCVDSRISQNVNSDPTLGTTAYLMQIEDELYQEDQEELEQRTLEREEGLRAGSDANGAVGKNGRYVPKEGITIEHATN